MSVNHHFASRCVDIIRALANKWNILLPASANNSSAFRHHDQRPSGSPPESQFFASAIPRKPSSSIDPQSATPFASQPGTPFPPQSQTPIFYGDDSTLIDPSGRQNTFWTPFPLQGMPFARPQDLTTLDFSTMEGPHHWPQFDETAGRQEFHQPQQSAPHRFEDTGGGFPDWNWQ